MPDEKKNVDTASSSRSRTGATHPGGSQPRSAFDADDPAVSATVDWIREHQTVALLGAFAVGAFIGALLRE